MNKEEYFLLRKLNEGDISVMEVIYFRYAPQIKAFVSAILKDPADTEDLVQDIFLKIWDDRETVCHAKSFRSYLIIGGLMQLHLEAEIFRNHFLGEIVFRGAEAAGGDDDIAAGKGLL